MKGNNQKGTKVVNSNLILSLNIIIQFFRFLFLKSKTKPKTKQSTNLLIQNQKTSPNKKSI